MIPPQSLVAFALCIAAGQRNDSYDLWMTDKIRVQIGLLGQRELEHDQSAVWQSVERLGNCRFEQLLGAGLVRAVNVHFRFDNRHQVCSDDLSRDVELLYHDLLDPG